MATGKESLPVLKVFMFGRSKMIQKIKKLRARVFRLGRIQITFSIIALSVFAGLILSHSLGGMKASTHFGSVIVSADSDFDSVSSINVSGPNISTVETNWLVTDKHLGEWRHRGLGGKPPAEALIQEDNPGYFLHPWVRDPKEKEEWYDSNISQDVSIPADAKEVEAVLHARSGAHKLINQSKDRYPACVWTLMSLNVKKGKELVSKTTYVRQDTKRLVMNLEKFAGEEIRLIAGVEASWGRCNMSHKWLEIRSLKIKAES